MGSREKLSLKIVRKLLGAPAVPVGFQHRSGVVEFEREVGFATSDAIATLIREERRSLLNSELAKQRKMVRRLCSRIAAVSTEEELLRKCYDVSLVIAAMIEALEIRAVVYMGTMLVRNSETVENRSFYFLQDIFTPPADSNARGHSWISSSCYSVIDLTAKLQPIGASTCARIPSPVLIEHSSVMPFQEGWYFGSHDAEELKARKRKWL